MTVRLSTPERDALREAIAEIFYEVMPVDMNGLGFIGKPVWEPGKESPRQNEARRHADRVLKLCNAAARLRCRSGGLALISARPRAVESLTQRKPPMPQSSDGEDS